MLKEFKKFIARGNVMDLAVGVIVGSAFSAIVTSLVDNILMPVIGVLTGGIDFSTGDKSYAVIYEIDGMNIKEVYRYGDVYLSGWYGNFYVKDNIKHIN